MKKFLITLILIIFSANAVFCAEVSRLYRIKNAQPYDVDKIIAPYIIKKFPNVTKQGTYFIMEDSKYYYAISTTKKDGETYFYYMSNNEDEDFRKELCEIIKDKDLKRKKVFSSKLKSYFYGDAYTALAHSNIHINMRTTPDKSSQINDNSQPNYEITDYDFSENAQQRFNQAPITTHQNVVRLDQYPSTEPPIDLDTNGINEPYENNNRIVKLPRIESSNQSLYNQLEEDKRKNYSPQSEDLTNNVLQGSVIYVKDGTSFTAALLSDISSDSLTNNDRISAELDEDWVYNGHLIAPAGSILNGNAVDTRSASFAMRNGQIGLLFDEIMTPDGNIIPLKTNKVYIVGNSSRGLNVAKRIAAGAATGLLLSTVSMMLGADPTKAIIRGVSIGAGAGAISTVATKGEEIKIIEGSQLQILLTEPLTVQLYRDY